MKKILVTAFSVFSLMSFAQKPLEVTVTTNSSVKIYTVDVPQVNLKDTEKEWLKYTSHGSKGKSSNVNGEYIQSGAVNNNVSPNPFTLISKLTAATEGVRISLWLAPGSTSPASSTDNGSQDLALKKYVRDFAVIIYREQLEQELKAEKNKQEDMEKALAGVIKSQEKSEKTINENERENQKADDAIVTNKSDIKRSNEKISDQKEMVVYTAADPNATKGAKKTLKELEDDKKDLQKENANRNENIDDRNKESRAENRSLVNDMQSYEAKSAAIEKQKLVVLEVQNKLNNLK